MRRGPDSLSNQTVDLFRPSEGAGEQTEEGPKLSNSMKHRCTIPNGISPFKDNWREVAGELEVEGRPMEWTGRCSFYERRAAATDVQDPEED